MVEVLKYILFRSVLVVITLHSIIPHPHSDELTAEEHFELHKKSNSLFGIVRLIFHESNDKSLDNLIYAQSESVKKVDNKHWYPKVCSFNNIQSLVEKRETDKIIKSSTNNITRLIFVRLNRLRGPPILA